MFQLHLVNCNGHWENPPIPVYEDTDIPPDDITNDFLAGAYGDAFMDKHKNNPQLISCTFRATPSHRISDDFLAKLRADLGSAFRVSRVGKYVKIET